MTKLNEPTEKELLEFAEQEELFLFASESDYLAIANGLWELFIRKSNEANRTPTIEQEPYAWAIFDKTGEFIYSYTTEKEIAKVHIANRMLVKPLYLAPPDQSAKIAELEAQLRECVSALENLRDGNGLIEPIEQLIAKVKNHE